MGRQALLALACWLTLSLSFGDKKTDSSVIKDNLSAESAPRLYRNVKLGVYASAAPYGAHSFHLPAFIPAPKTAASQVAPVKENIVNHLTDSYGNKFVGTPQLSAYKIAFPQQFVALQTKLPQHLTQPLVAASANFQFKPSNSQFFGASYNVPAHHGSPTPLHHFPTFGQLYGNRVQSLGPSTVSHGPAHVIPNAQQQSTNNKVVFKNTQTHGQYKTEKEPQIIIGKPKLQGIQETHDGSHSVSKYQRIKEAPYSSYSETPKFQRIQEVPYYKEENPQRIQNTPQAHQGQLKQQSSDDTEKYRHIELPHYESKFQIINEEPYSPQFQRIQEHHTPHGEVKFQRLHEAPSAAQTHHTYEGSLENPRHGGNLKAPHENNAKLQAAPAKQTVTYINDINGEKTVVELETKPSLPLLDLTLLEPLTFDNPLVPQVQHFLPRINQATYQKLPEAIPAINNYQKEYAVQKTTSYNSADSHQKPLKEVSKKKHKKTQPNKNPKKNDVSKKSGTHHETLDDAPEIVYEINSPNYKKTVMQKAVSYNKETQSEPVHYTYGSRSEEDPVTYSYSRTTKDPAQVKSIEYNSNDPSHLIYTLTPEEQANERESANTREHHSESENEKESSQELVNEEPSHHEHRQHQQSYQPHPNHRSHQPQQHHEGHQPQEHHQSHQPQQHHQILQPQQYDQSYQHRQPQQHYHQHPEGFKENPRSAEVQNDNHESSKEKYSYHNKKEDKEQQQEIEQDKPPKYYSEPAHITSENINFQPILKEYENNIRLLTAPSASIKVDPEQHVNQPKPTPQAHVSNSEEDSHPQQLHTQPESGPHGHAHSDERQSSHYHSRPPHSDTYNPPAPHILEKSKRIIIQEESPDEMHMLREQMREAVIKREENSEEDFEKGYHDAAFGFPAYHKKSADIEKDIFDPESYGVPRDQVEYDFDHTPLQQYQEEGDAFPKETRSRYKDARDKTMQNYYSEFSISKPESMLDRYQNKLGYYKLYKKQKPDYFTDDNDNDKKQAKSAKYSAAPSFAFNDEKRKSYYGNPQQKQQLYEYDYSKGTPRDNSAFASRPYQNYKSRTSFVEPQFQYGFEPIAIPKLLDSELAAMASNDSPESEKPGMRKKIYKENWYIKKTSTSAGTPAR